MSGYNQRPESDEVKLLRVQLEVVNAQNDRLNEENSLLRHKLDRLTNEYKSSSHVQVESKLKVFALEDERDKMFESLEKLKTQYNKLHSAYLEKVKRCKSLEEVFSRQKTLPGLVMKSVLEQARNQAELNKMDQKPPQQQQQQKHHEDENISAAKVTELQRSLNEAFDIIDELEFELESVDFLEMENERLKNELSQLKKDAKTNVNNSHSGAYKDHQNDHHNRSSTCSPVCDECGCDGLPDIECIERSVLTESLIDTAQAESHLLRRELLRSRLQNTRPQRTSVGPKSET